MRENQIHLVTNVEKVQFQKLMIFLDEDCTPKLKEGVIVIIVLIHEKDGVFNMDIGDAYFLDTKLEELMLQASRQVEVAC